MSTLIKYVPNFLLPPNNISNTSVISYILCMYYIYFILQWLYDANIKCLFISFKEKKWMSLKAKLTDRDLNTAVKLHCQPCNKF